MEDFSIDEKCLLINLAMHVTTGAVSYKVILNNCKSEPEEWKKIFYFWAEFNEMTRKAIKLLSLEYNYIRN